MFQFGAGAQLVANTVTQQYNAAERARAMRVAKAWRYYGGDYPLPLKAVKSDPDGRDNITFNLARFTVNIAAFFLYGKGVTFQVEREGAAGEDAPKNPLDTRLEKIWRSNQKDTLLLDMAINGGVTGDVFLRVKEAGPGGKYPRILLLDSGNVSVTWQPDDYNAVVEYKNQWNAQDPITGKAMVYRQTFRPNGRQWHIQEEVCEATSAKWRTTGEYDWKYAWSPIFHCKNLPCPNAYYGTADLEEDVLDSNDDVNFTVSNISRILRVHAHPKTWGKGFTAKSVNTSVDSLTILEDPGAELHNLEMVSDLSSSLEFFRAVKEVFHQITNVPEIAAGKVDNIGQLSGLAMQILYGPLMRLIETKQLFYGGLKTDLNARLLEMDGAGEEQVVNNQWVVMLPKDAAAEADAALAKQEAGVSKETTLIEMGYDAAEEAKKRAAEAQTAQQMGADMLSSFEKGQLSGQKQSGGGDADIS